MPPSSDLVRDSKLETRILNDQTVHSCIVTNHSRRRIYREEYWKRERLLGQGSYGQVWLEKCTSTDNTGQLRAVKVVRKQPNLNTIDYDRELEAVAKFSHTKYETWFVKSLGWYEDVEAVYIAMEYCPLGDLQRYISSKASLPSTEVQELTYQVLEGLHEMHENGFTHRDLKPANILIKSQPSEFWWVKLADFGISKRAEDGNGPSTVKGTLEYMAPELLGFVKPTDPKSPEYQAADMWALGETVFRMLTGKRTFEDIRTLSDYCRGTQDFPYDRLIPSAGDNGARFISNLMAVDQHLRMSVTDALQHPWLKLHSMHMNKDLPLGPNSQSLRLENIGPREEPQPSPFYEASARWSTFSNTGTIELPVQSRIRELSHPASIPNEKQSKPTKLIAHIHSDYNSGQDLLKQEHRHPSYAQIDRNSNSSSSQAQDVLTIKQLQSVNPQVELEMELLENPVQDQPPGQNHHLKIMQKNDSFGSVQDQPQSPSLFAAMARKMRRNTKLPKDSGVALQTLNGHLSSVTAVAFSPDGKQLASASYDKTVRLWDTSSGATLQKLEGHSNRVTAVAFPPDGKQLASVSYDKTVRLRDTSSGATLQKLKGHLYRVTAVAFSPDGKQLASASDNKTVRLWDTSSGATLQKLEGHLDWVIAVAFSPDGKQLASASYDMTVRLWDTGSGVALHMLTEHSNPVTAVAFSPDGKQLASVSYNKTVRLWDTSSGATMQKLEGHSYRVTAVAFSPDGKQLASASDDKTVRLWDTSSGATLQKLEGHSYRVIAVAFSPDGKQLASASIDKTVGLWDTSSGATLQKLKGHSNWVIAVAFSPDGKQLASASQDKTIKLWNAG